MIALVGISGVGKTSLLRTAQSSIGFLHLQASSLILHERQTLGRATVSSEELQRDDIEQNQVLLVTAFKRETKDLDGVVVLDGHVVVDSPGGQVDIPPRVFQRIGVKHFVFLQDSPTEIAKRRAVDASKARPVRDLGALGDHQSYALKKTAEIALATDCQLSIITPRHALNFVQLINDIDRGRGHGSK